MPFPFMHIRVTTTGPVQHNNYRHFLKKLNLANCPIFFPFPSHVVSYSYGFFDTYLTAFVIFLLF